MITENQIKAALRNIVTSGKQRIELRDDGDRGAGRLMLLVRIQKRAGRLEQSARVISEWYSVFWIAKRRGTAKIGNYPDVSLADARKVHREKFSPLISAGVPPTSERAQRRAEAQDVSVKALFEAYVDSLKGERPDNPRAAWNAARLILLDREDNAAVDFFGAKRSASSITAEDVVDLLAKIYETGKIVMAKQTRSYLSSAFNFGMRNEHNYTNKQAHVRWGIKVNPVAAVAPDFNASRMGTRFLSPAEIRAFWNWLGSDNAPVSRMCKALRLQLAMGQRTEEILRMSEKLYMKGDQMMYWDKTKNGRPHAVPLPRQAVDILSEMEGNEHGLYFPRFLYPEKPQGYHAVTYVINEYLEATGAAHFSARDIRRTWKTMAGRAGLTKDIRDRLQNHVFRDVSSRHYDRYDYIKEKRAAVEVWEVYLDRILSGEFDNEGEANVVPIKRKKAA